MDDIYDFISKFAQRIDETEEVKHMFADNVYFIINKLWMLTLWKTIIIIIACLVSLPMGWYATKANLCQLEFDLKISFGLILLFWETKQIKIQTMKIWFYQTTW